MDDLFDAATDPSDASAIKALQRQAARIKAVDYVELTARLPHLILMAAVAEETGKAAGSTKLRGLGVPLPFTDHDGTATMVRLWAIWAKQKGGIAKLRGFEVRLGKERSGKRLATLYADNCQSDDSGETLAGHPGFYINHPKYPIAIARMTELQRRLDDAAELALSDDPLAAMARNAVHEASSDFCCCCGRTLTDPLSVRTGVGPECGASFHRVVLERWKAARSMGAAA